MFGMDSEIKIVLDKPKPKGVKGYLASGRGFAYCRRDACGGRGLRVFS